MGKGLDPVVVQMPRMTRRRFMRNALWGAGIVSAGAGMGDFLTACARAASTTVGHTTFLTFQQSWLLDVEFAGLYAAIERGYFKNFGLDVTPVPGGTTIDPRTVVSSGAALVGSVAEGTDEVLGISNGADYKAIAAVYQQNPGCLMVHPDITSVTQLEGKSIGLQNPARQQVLAILRYNNVPVNSVKLVTVGFDPTPFVLGKVDAYTAFAFNEPVALGLKGIQTRCFSFSDIGLPAYGDAIIAKRETIASSPDLLARFVKALQQGWEYTVAHTDEVATFSLRDFAREQDPKQQRAQIKVEIPMLSSPATKEHGLLWMESSVWQQSIAFMSNAKLLGKPLTVDDVMTMDILSRAKTL